MPDVQGCDLLPFSTVEIEGSVAIEFDFDLLVEIGFVRDGRPVWGTAGSPLKLSDLIRDHAPPEAVREYARDLAVKLATVVAEASP